MGLAKKIGDLLTRVKKKTAYTFWGMILKAKLEWLVWCLDFWCSYPLVNVNKKLWKDPPCLMGNVTISVTIFNSYVKLPEGK